MSPWPVPELTPVQGPALLGAGDITLPLVPYASSRIVKLRMASYALCWLLVMEPLLACCGEVAKVACGVRGLESPLAVLPRLDSSIELCLDSFRLVPEPHDIDVEASVSDDVCIDSPVVESESGLPEFFELMSHGVEKSTEPRGNWLDRGVCPNGGLRV
jgi:hypothetical protein